MKPRISSNKRTLSALFFGVGLTVTAAACTDPDAMPADMAPGASDASVPDAHAADLRTPDMAVPPDLASGEYCATAAGKSGRELFMALGACIAGHTSLSYAAARDEMFSMLSDPADNNSVQCFYTGRKAPQVTDRASANLAMLNTEHSWPQSLGATGTAMTDIHHLFPTDVMANGQRANYPFGVVKTATWTGPDLDGKGPSKLGARDDGKTVFEPRDPVKGNIARAIFYFYTRYAAEKPMSFSTVNFQVEEETLHKWHEQDPPDAAEKAHNDATFLIQRNRNPYIDHPEYVGKVGNFLTVP